MYHLDFKTVMYMMQEHQKTGVLYTDVPSNATILREPCHIEIKLEDGNLISCSIVGTNSGRRITGKEAINELSRLGQLSWTLTFQQTTGKQPTAPIPALSAPVFRYPQRTAQVNQQQLHSWPRMHRTVFALADGTKSVVKIAEILSTPPEVINGVLRDLQSIGVITMK